ncbi:hypothetical protein [Pseudoroseicyclus tamaricis]|uniref:Uncharacterized protein n=1 Tax=Pseudoroseicyclus tamaricis TaxID=2705421 RepID=A0A6B2JUY6_9RHOB|nr:hypothetical protein [Pseudoroseicyclus tamaricis]NDV02317.1 hypothetical protein [Pseudoroseicyclus tamaricis]
MAYLPTENAEHHPAYEAVDFALAYFIWAHSLREWLIVDGGVEKAELDAFLAKFPCWFVCRDIANRTRHLDLKRSPTDKDWEISRSYVPFSEQLSEHGEYEWLVHHNDDRFMLAELVSKVQTMWQAGLDHFHFDPEPARGKV